MTAAALGVEAPASAQGVDADGKGVAAQPASEWGSAAGAVAHVLERRVFPQLDFQDLMRASAACRRWAALSAALRAGWKEELAGEHLSAFSPD